MWWNVVNAVTNLQVPYNAQKFAYFLPGRAKDLSEPQYFV